MVQSVGGAFYISTDTYATEYDGGGGGWVEVTESGFYEWAASNAVYADDGFGNYVDVVGGDNKSIVSSGNDYYGVSVIDQPGNGTGSTAGAVSSANNDDVKTAGGDYVTQDSFPFDGTGVYTPGSINTPVEYGDFGEDLSAAAQDKRETTTDDPVAYVTAMYQELITDATNAKAEIVSGVVGTELAYQSGTSNDRVIGPGIGGNSTTIDVIESKFSYVDLIANTAGLVDDQDPNVLAAINNGLPNPLDYNYNLATETFASNEDAELYAQARVDNIANKVSLGLDGVVIGYQVQQQFLTSNTDTFTLRNADGTFQILPYTLQSQLKELNDPQVSQAIVIAIQNAGGDINGADLSFNNLERIAEQYNIRAIVDEDIRADGPGAVQDSSGNPTPGGDLVSRVYESAGAVQSGTETFIGQFPDITSYTPEERAILNEGLDRQIISVSDRNVTGVQEALSKAQDIEQLLATDGYGVGLDQDQKDYLKDSLAGTVNYATAYAAAYALVDSAVNSIAAIQTTDSSGDVTAQRQELASSLWSQLTPFEQQVARDTGLAGELDQLTRNTLGILDAGNIKATPYTSTEILPDGVQGLVDAAISAYISINGSITEEQAAKIENAILDANQAQLHDLTAADIGVAGREYDLNLITQVNAEITTTTQIDRPLQAVKAQTQTAAPPEPQYLRQSSAKQAAEITTLGIAGVPTINPTSEQQAQSKEFSATVTASTAEQADLLAQEAARQKAVDALGPNVAFTGVDSVRIVINDNGTYTATFTTAAVYYYSPTGVTGDATIDAENNLNGNTGELTVSPGDIPVTIENDNGTLVEFTENGERIVDADNPDYIVTDDGLRILAEDIPVDLARDENGGLVEFTENGERIVDADNPDYIITDDGLRVLAEDIPVDVQREADGTLVEFTENGERIVDAENPDYVVTDGGLRVLPEDLVDDNANNDDILSLLSDNADDEAATIQAATQRAQAQQAIEEQRKQANGGDWRVKLRLAGGSDYLYNDPDLTEDGLLWPLAVTSGVVFPYTPTINTTYAANYSTYDLTHSNYRGHFYQNSYVDDINLTATFTAQDTQEANYLLAVIHFFRSATKMFYGQDAQRGSPPPLVFLQGLGEFQFNLHPCVIRSFSYNLPNDVDYIRARSPNLNGTNLQSKRNRQTVSSSPLAAAIDRLRNAGLSGLNPGALSGLPAPATLGTNSPTYVPTKMEINITLLPTQTREQVSKQFSVKSFANGDLLKGGFW